MSLNESIGEDAALIMPAATLTRPLPLGEEQSRVAASLIPAFCLRPFPLRSGSQREKVTEQGKRVGQSRVAQTLIPALSHGEKEKREAIRRPAGAGSAIPEEARGGVFRPLLYLSN